MKESNIQSLFLKLSEFNPKAETELYHKNTFELLISVILSAQATDISVNKATPKLFEAFPTPESMYNAGAKKIWTYIRSIGLAPTKSKNIIFTYWNGEISLVKSFWIVAVVLLTIVSIPSYIIDDQAISKMSDGVAIAILVWTVFFYLFLIYTYVGLWRSSSKYIADRRKSKRSNSIS